ncbi:Na+/H+ antiporter NhaC family protein [Sedimentibacter hydroxybenzoicus DSM 7310]|uniref:Na+/H+ antiporter NhaC family protein n=1 Tax=Sedimentibacter hydroxybenzoicus DSM 7310 TaxID=1123245 RepID=A0A974BKY8_SEDHY|nr:Na+/H+ antiporter NhaC family protein [Sedimentibacter hydroxybenzoicus]NYB75255.1 Na+/H+ antiporter NhaC family protein [Sedimentibacter hydroxybenzoicus DSM 7310]
MELVSVGWLSIIPPIVAIALALATKEVILSLVIGILSGTVIYTVALGQNLFMGTIITTFNLLMNQVDIGLLIVLGMLGAVIEVVTLTGGQHAVSDWAQHRIKTKTSTNLATLIVGSSLFLSDTFHNLTTGAIMKPITDGNKLSRAKLAYILDATAAPVCCLVPMGIWVAGISSTIPENTTFNSTMEAFLATVPFNLYCFISIVLVIYFSFPKNDFGPMYLSELKADTTGDLGSIDQPTEINKNGRIIDMFLPLAVLILVTLVFMLYTGGFWNGRGFIEAFSYCSTSVSLQAGCFVALIVAFVMTVPRKTVPFRKFMKGINDGAKSMVEVSIILILAWTIGGCCRHLLGTGIFVGNMVAESGMPLGLIPGIIFLVAAALSFATGTSWGTFGILMPLVFTICEVAAPELLVVSMSSVLGGSVWGDHCSPISDTTILASASAGCDHIKHVETQLPYCIVGGICAVIGYFAAGFSKGNLILTLVVSFGLLSLILFVQRKSKLWVPSEHEATSK